MNSNNQNTFDNTEFDSQNRAGDNIPSSGMGMYDQQASGVDSPSMGGGYGQQTTGRDQFSDGGQYDSYGGAQRQPGDTTGTQGFGTGNDFENRATSDEAGFTGTQNYGTANQDNTTSQMRQPGLGDKVKGTAEIATGKVMHNPGMVERGEERKNL